LRAPPSSRTEPHPRQFPADAAVSRSDFYESWRSLTPELRVEREEYTDRPTTWKIVVESASIYEEVPIDANHYAAMKVAIGIHLVDLVKAIERDHAWIVAEMDLAGMVIELLRREREKAS